VRYLYTILFLLIASTAFGTTYHIDPDYGSGGDGAYTTPYDEWNDLPSMSNGDDVYLKCDTILSPTSYLNVTWEGVDAGNPTVIGSYYMDGGSPIYGVSGNRPIIEGNYTVPTSIWSGMINVSSKDYVHIENLHIKQSHGYGIYIYGDVADGGTPVDPWTDSDYFQVTNCKIEGAWLTGILINENPTNYGVVDGCEVTRTAYGWKYGGMTDWAAALVVTHSPQAYTTIKNCYIHENWGEGLGGFTDLRGGITDVGYVTIEDNIVWNNRRVDLYLNAMSNCTVRRNILLGAATDAEFMSGGVIEGRRWNQYGIWLNSEDNNGRLSNANNNLIYNNLVAGHYSGIGHGTESSTIEQSGNKIFNNVSVGNRYNYSISNNLENATYTGNETKNNIFYCPTGTLCSNTNATTAWKENFSDMDHNAWSGSIPAIFGDTATDVLMGSGDLATSSINWQNITEGDIPNIENAVKLIIGSAMINAGTTDADGPDEDFWGNSRPIDTIDDIGLHEFGAPTQNNSPIISAFTPANQCIAEGNNVSLTHTSTDPDSDALTYLWTDNGTALASNSTAEDPGNYGATQWSNGETHVIELTVSDGNGGEDSQSSTITVSASCGGSVPTTVTIGRNSTNDVDNTVDCNIRAQTADRDTAYNNNKIEIEDPITDDTGQKAGLIQFDTITYTGITATRARLCVNIQQAPDIASDLDLYDSDNEFTEAATWNAYDGSNSWAESNSPETGSILESHTVTNSTTGAICFDSDDTAGLLTHVNNHMGGVTSFVVAADTETDTDIELVSSEGADGSRPYLELTYNTGGSTDLVSCEWGNPDSTLGESDLLYMICYWNGLVNLTNSETLTIATTATGATVELVAIGDGNDTQQLTFTETIPASATTGASELALSPVGGANNDMVLSGGTFTGDREFSDLAAINLPDGSGNIYIDTTADTWTSSCVVAVGGTACVTADHVFTRGQKPRFKLTAATAITLSGGAVNDVTLTVDIDAGDDLVFRPVSGVGTAAWVFEAQAVESDMTDAALAAAAVGDLTHAGITLEDLSGTAMTNTDLPQTALDPTYTCTVDGSARTWTNRSAGGSVTTVR
jgi:hypothetical protein